MKIGIAGCRGKMGQMLIRELLSDDWPQLELAGGSVETSEDKRGTGFPVTQNAEELFAMSDAVIDFTAPEATRRHVWLAAKHRRPIVIGTTGLTEVDEKELEDASRECPIVYAANMSVGVNLLLALVEQAAARLDSEWDIEIFETHHRHKIDAPSGTALALGKAAKTGRGGDGAFITDRNGKRKTGDIGFAVQRGSDIVGEHVVSFFGAGERIELAHKATDRTIFAKGALRAALWAAGQKPGLYSMRDVLGL